MAGGRRGDELLSQPIRALERPADVLAREAPVEQETDEERVRRLTEDHARDITWQRLDRHLNEHIKLTREMLQKVGDADMRAVTQINLLKDIHSELRGIREQQVPQRELVNLFSEIRDEMKGLREFLQLLLSNGHAPH